MKYWVFQNNQVNGPYEPEDISQLPGFSAETLVCPEGRKGTNMGDWQRAGMVPELSVSLLKASQLAASLRGGSPGGVYASLPPEPTLRDLAALGSLQEKVSLLDGAVSQLQETLRLKEDELLSLHRELEEKSRYAQDLAIKLGGLEEKVSTVGKLQQHLDKAVAAEQDVESTVKEQSRIIEDLSRQIQGLKSEIKQGEAVSREISSLKAELKQKESQPPLDLSRFQTREAREAAPEPKHLPEIKPPSEPKLDLPPMPRVTPENPRGIPPAAKLPEPLVPTPDLPLPSAPLPFTPMAAPPPALAAAAGAAKIAAPQIIAGPPPAAGGKGKGLMGILILAGAGSFAAFQQGLLPVGKKTAVSVPLSETTPLPPPETPATEVNPPPQTPEEQLEQSKAAAILAVKNWPLGGGGSTLGQALEASWLSGQGLSPWMADSIKDDLFQVNFYGQKGGGRPARTYEFQVRLSDKQVSPHNAAARDLLSSTPAAPPAPAPTTRATPRRKAPASQDGPVLDDLLTAPGEDAAAPPPPTAAAPASAPTIKPKKKAQAPRDPALELDELISGAPTPAPKAKAKPKEPESLDEMLLPGVPKKSAPDEPQAQPLVGQGEAAPKAKKPTSKSKAADAKLLDELLEP